jgi:hypothetical protein
LGDILQSVSTFWCAIRLAVNIEESLPTSWACRVGGTATVALLVDARFTEEARAAQPYRIGMFFFEADSTFVNDTLGNF